MSILHTIRKWLTRRLAGKAPIEETKLGTTWFLDYVHGDDANDGLSPETAFLTHVRVAEAVDASDLGPQQDMIFQLLGNGQVDEVFVQIEVYASGQFSVIPTLARAHIATSLAQSIAAAYPPGKYKLVLVKEQHQ